MVNSNVVRINYKVSLGGLIDMVLKNSNDINNYYFYKNKKLKKYGYNYSHCNNQS